MKRRRRELANSVVVVTGASSGIGRQTCVELTREGCRVVGAARRADALEETARLCAEITLPDGSRPPPMLCVPTDVTVEREVEALAARALEQWGRIDTWVNGAGTTLFAPLTEGSFAEHRRVVETNVFGAMLCARAVLPIFRDQGSGALVNLGSLLSKVGQPFVPSYSISKFALRGLSESLRVELADDPDIHVCSIYPYATDTPHFETGGNEVGRRAHTMPPVQSPETVARAIVDLCRRPRREVHVPKIAVLGLAVRWAFPKTTERTLLHSLERWHFDRTAEETGPGNLFAPEHREASVHGSRRPRLSAPRFFTWLLGELARIGVRSATENVTHAHRAVPATPSP